MEKIVFNDPKIAPDNTKMAAILGDKMAWWNAITDGTLAKDPAMTPVWKYYNDGKAWLFRILRKKNTIFWGAILEESFRISFYFGDKAIGIVEESNLEDDQKELFRNAPRYGSFRGVSIKMEKEEDVETVLQWVSIKLQIK